MTVRRHWKTRIPFTDIEMQRSRVLRPGYREGVVLWELNDSSMSGPAYFSARYEMRVHPGDRVTFDIRDRSEADPHRGSFNPEHLEFDAEYSRYLVDGKTYKLSHDGFLTPKTDFSLEFEPPKSPERR